MAFGKIHDMVENATYEYNTRKRERAFKPPLIVRWVRRPPGERKKFCKGFNFIDEEGNKVFNKSQYSKKYLSENQFLFPITMRLKFLYDNPTP